VEVWGFEPQAYSLQSYRSSQLSYTPGINQIQNNTKQKNREGNEGFVTELFRKEVIQPHFPVRLPCYDFTPLTRHTFGVVLLAVRLATSGTPNSGGVTGGVYKARERIHRAMLMRDY
jgi:hypothetical protein